MPQNRNAPTNGNHGRAERAGTIKQRSVLLGQKRVDKGRTKTSGGDDPRTRDKGRGK